MKPNEMRDKVKNLTKAELIDILISVDGKFQEKDSMIRRLLHSLEEIALRNAN